MSQVETFRNDPDLSEMLDNVSKKTGISKSELIRLAIADKYGDEQHIILAQLARRLRHTKAALMALGIPDNEARALIIERTAGI